MYKEAQVIQKKGDNQFKKQHDRSGNPACNLPCGIYASIEMEVIISTVKLGKFIIIVN